MHPNIYAFTQLCSYTHIYFPCMISYSLTYDFIHVYARVCMPMYYILNLCLLFHDQTYIFLIIINFHILFLHIYKYTFCFTFWFTTRTQQHQVISVYIYNSYNIICNHILTYILVKLIPSKYRIYIITYLLHTYSYSSF